MRKTVEELLASLRDIVDAAEKDERDLTDEEAANYEAIEVELAAARRTAEIRNRQDAYETPVRDDLHVHVAPAKPDNSYAKAFDQYLRTGRPNADLQAIQNAQGVGTDSAGGFTVPEEFRQRLVERMVEFGGIANEVEVISTAGGEPMRWPTLDDTANEGEIAAEGAGGVAGSDLAFGEITLGAFKYVAPGGDASGAAPLRVSVELLQDSAFDIAGLVARKLGERIARKQADDWVNGAGTTEPFGITTSTGPSFEFPNSPTGATGTDALIDALHSVDPAYRANGVWAFNDTTLARFRKLKDADDRPLWVPLESAGLETVPGGSLLGHRVRIDQAFANFVDASGNTFGAFGDLREAYVIRRVQEVTLIVDPFTRAHEGQVLYTVWARADGVVQNPNAIVLLTNAAI